MNLSDKPFSVLSLADEPAVPVLGGSLQWIPVRRRLGIESFGTNAYRAAKAGDAVIEEHVESPGQEELYVVIAGRARFSVDGEVEDVSAGGALFVPLPDRRRGAVALEDDTIVLAVGGWVGKPYHSLPWEPIYLAQVPISAGDWATAVQILETESGEHRESGIIRFRLACCLAQLGEFDRALDELKSAVEASPGLRERAAQEELLGPLRELDAWSAALA